MDFTVVPQPLREFVRESQALVEIDAPAG